MFRGRLIVPWLPASDNRRLRPTGAEELSVQDIFTEPHSSIGGRGSLKDGAGDGRFATLASTPDGMSSLCGDIQLYIKLGNSDDHT